MFGLFGSRVSRNWEVVNGVEALHSQQRLALAFSTLLDGFSDETCSVENATDFTASSVVAVMSSLLGQIGRPVETLNYEKRFVVGLIGFLFSEKLSDRTGADLGIVLAVAGSELFARDEIADIYKLGSSYHRLRQHKRMHHALGDIIDRFLSSPNKNTLEEFACVIELCLGFDA